MFFLQHIPSVLFPPKLSLAQNLSDLPLEATLGLTSFTMTGCSRSQNDTRISIKKIKKSTINSEIWGEKYRLIAKTHCGTMKL